MANNNHITENYIRVGTTYYKIVNEPDLYNKNKTRKKLIKWDRASIIEDHGKDMLKSIKKYNGFINFPSHTDYQKNINGFYNEYHELEGEIEKGDLHYTKQLLKHIFGDQYIIGLDYLTILWRYPSQFLPILCLVSQERNTGKTTFLNWLGAIFEANFSIIKKRDLLNKFNDSWINSLIIAIDEVKFDSRYETDHIKEMSTAKYQQREQKGKDKFQAPFFGKIVLASNNINDFIIIDKEEIRFWVRDIKSIENYIDDFEEKLKAEIPAFKYFLNNREILSPKTSRMWFKPEVLKTTALQRVVTNSYGLDEKDLIEMIDNLFELSKSETIKLTLGDIHNNFTREKVFVRKSEIKSIIQDKWKLLPSENATTYKYYNVIYSYQNNTEYYNVENRKGRVYTFEKAFMDSLKNC